MFPRISRSNKKSGTYEYLVISESVHVKGKGSTTRDIAKLGNVKKLNPNEIENLIDGLIRLFQVEKYSLSKQVETLTTLNKSTHTQLRAITDKVVERYLSWQFGVFGTGNFGQEVSWNWIDLAINSGVEDYLQTYMRYYEKDTPVSGYFFLNTLTR